MLIKKAILTTIITLLVGLGLSACANGPAEEAGEHIDELVDDAGNAVEDACEKVKEGVDAKDQDC